MGVRFLFVVTLAIIALSGHAFAGKSDPTWNPPARYDYPYKGRLEVHYLPQPEVFKKCRHLHQMAGTPGPSKNVRGCAKPNSDHCIIFLIDKPVAVKDKPWVVITPEAVRRHEMGHCNGWHPSHPD